MDAVLGKEQELNAKDEWERLESRLTEEYYEFNQYWKMILDVNCTEKLRYKSNELIVSRLELFFRAICRQFIFGTFSSESKIFMFQIESFSDIKDENIGKIQWSKYKINERIK